MSSTNDTAEAAFQSVLPHFVLTDVLVYSVFSIVLFVNGGIVLIYFIQRFRKPSSAQISPAGLVVLNLLISDALVGAMGISLTASYTAGHSALTPYGCVIRAAIRYFFRMGSHMALINVALDRYIAIMYTLRYRDWVTTEKAILLISIGWVVPICGVAYVILGNSWKPGLLFCYQVKSYTIFLTYVRLPSHLAALVFVIAIQGRIYIQLKHYEKETSHHVLRRYSHKSARSLMWVTSTYVICWLPFDIMLLLILFDAQPSVKIIFDGTVVLAHMSFLVNAFIFSYKTESIRKPVSDFCCDLWNAVICRKKSEPSSGEIKTVGVTNAATNRQSSVDTSNITVTSSISSQRKVPSRSASIHM